MNRTAEHRRGAAALLRRHARLALVLAAGPALIPTSAARAASPSCAMTLFADFQSVSTNRAKPGTPGFHSRHHAPAEGGPIYYLTNTVLRTESIRVGGRNYAYSSWLESTRLSWFPTDSPYTNYDHQADCPTTSPQVKETAVVNHEGSYITGCEECDAVLADGQWQPDSQCPTCHDVLVRDATRGWDMTVDRQTNETARVETWSYRDVGGSGDAYRDHEYHRREVTLLSGEYTTASLIADTVAASTNLAWPESWSPHGQARLSLSDASDCARVSRLRYRFRFLGPRGETATLRWVERFSPEDGGPAVDSHRSRPVRFTGQVQEIVGTLDPPSVPGTVLLIPPGSSGCALCGGGEAHVDLGRGPEIFFGLGPATRDLSAGFLLVDPSEDPEALASPAQLGALAPSGYVTEVRNATGLRQVRAPSLVADIREQSPHTYAVRFFDPIPGPPGPEGLWPLPEEPFVTWTLSLVATNPVTLEISRDAEHRGTFRREADGWTLLRADGGSATQVESRSSPDGRLETQITRKIEADGTLAEEATAEYRVGVSPHAPWLLRRTMSGGDKEERWEYHDELPDDDPRHGLPRLHVDTDGSWERFEYEPGSARLSRVVAGFLNAPPQSPENACRVWTLDYTPFHPEDTGRLSPETPRTVTEHLLGRPITREFNAITGQDVLHIRALHPGAGWNQPGNLTTQTRRVATPGGFGEWTFHPDGTLTVTHLRTNLLTGGLIETRDHGLADDPELAQPSVAQGERAERRFDGQGRLEEMIRTDIQTGAPLEHRTFAHDARGRLIRESDLLRNLIREQTHGCCGAGTEQDWDGAVTIRTLDALDRLATRTSGGVTWSNAYDAADRLIGVWRIGSDGSAWALEQRAYDAAGRLLARTNALGHATLHRRGRLPDGSRWTKTLHPDGHVERQIRYRDGQEAERNGSATFPARLQYGIEDAGDHAVRTENVIHLNGQDTSQWTRTYLDPLERPYRVEQPTAAGGTSAVHLTFHDASGRVWKEVDPDGVVTLHESTGHDRVITHGIDHDRDDRLAGDGGDAMTRVETVLTQDNGRWYREERTWAWPETGLDTPRIIRFERRSLDDRFHVTVEHGRTNRISYSVLNDGLRYRTNQSWRGAIQVTCLEAGRPVLETWGLTQGTLIARTNLTYDAHGRLARIQDALRGGVITHSYDRADRLTAETSAEPGAPARTTRFEYDARGRLEAILEPDGTELRQAWTGAGLLEAQWGSATRTVELDHDDQGRLITQRTWMDPGRGTPPSVTSWTYDQAQGRLRSKTYPDGARLGYEHTPAGRLLSFRNARGLGIIHTHDASGRRTVEHCAATSWTRTWRHDRMGRAIEVIDGETRLRRSLNEHGSVLSDQTSHPALGAWTLTNQFDPLQRRVWSQLPGTTPLFAAYDPQHRPVRCQSGTLEIEFAYAGPDLTPIDGSYRRESVETLHVRRTLDPSGRVQTLEALPSRQAPHAFVFTYDAQGRRVLESGPEGVARHLEYNPKGELVRAFLLGADGLRLPGHQWHYAYDEMGNRTAHTSGGDPWGQSLVPVSFSVNALHQYQHARHPEWMLLSGRAQPEARVTVNQQAAHRAGPHFWMRLPTGARPAPRFQSITNMAVRPGTPDRASVITGQLFLAQSPALFRHDADGNLVQDSRWVYEWDSCGRLAAMETRRELPASTWRRLTFTYDGLDRRIAKTVQSWQGQQWSEPVARILARDGWRVRAELDASGAVHADYLWADTPAATGDTIHAGGMLLGARLVHHGAVTSAWWCVSDPSGHPRSLVDADGAVESLRLDTGPFGEPVGPLGGAPAGMPVGFAGRYTDRESGLVDFGRRFYHPSLGRWLSRDPLGEAAGLNLYAYADNDPINGLDPIGLEAITEVTVKRKRIRWLAILRIQLGKQAHPDDPYGHWWLEFDGESYGWWPRNGVSLLTTLTGVPGQLNGTDSMHQADLASPTRDGHHGDTADQEFHPQRRRGFLGGAELEHGQARGRSCRCATPEEIKDCLRDFAAQYSGRWSFPWGQNCHSFQRGAMRQCCLKK